MSYYMLIIRCIAYGLLLTAPAGWEKREEGSQHHHSPVSSLSVGVVPSVASLNVALPRFGMV